MLLAKQYRGTIYENSAASALCFFFSKGMKLKHPRQFAFNPGMAKKYEWVRNAGRAAISKAKKNTFPAREVESGKIIGSVFRNDPRVLAGLLVHHSKGQKASEATIAKIKAANQGMKNGNAKLNITEQDLIRVFKNSLIDGKLTATVFFQRLKVELGCTEGLIQKRYGSFTKFRKALPTAIKYEFNPYDRSDRKKYKTNVGWIWMSKDNVAIQVQIKDQEKFLQDGFCKGRKC
jgi:hypothetical protein